VGTYGVIEYGIPGVSYDIIGHQKFIYLPDEDGQTYTTQAIGTDTGTFDLVVSTNESGTVTGQTVFNDIHVTTATHVSFGISAITTDDVIMVATGSEAPSAVHADAVLSGEETQDLFPPITTATITGTLGSGGSYTTPVDVTLSATDTVSGVLVTKYSLDGGLTFLPYTTPIHLTQSGTHTIQYFSTDRAGNDETIRSVTISISNTPPVTDTDGDGIPDPSDDCKTLIGTSAFRGCASAVRFSLFERHRVGSGHHPQVTTEPVTGAVLRLFDKRNGSCAKSIGLNVRSYDDIFNTCTPVSQNTTDSQGKALLGLQPNIEWLVIGHDPVTGVYSKKLVKANPGQLLTKKMHVIVNHRGHAMAADDDEDHGSILYTIHPEEIIWDDTTEPYPYVFESDGDWDVSVSIEPPEGFVSDVSSLSTSVNSTTQALQFNVTDIGSCWECGTSMRVTLKHEGRTVTRKHLTPTPMTEDFMRRKGMKREYLIRRGVGVVSERRLKMGTYP
jgi:hypothetical protein